jgi:transcriptional regulator with XRE-family HTH domain
MILLRRVIGDALRARRQSQHRTLREVSTAANVSLGYLSEIERGQKEASSELLAAICDALGAQLSELLREVSQTVAVAESVTVPSARPTVPAEKATSFADAPAADRVRSGSRVLVGAGAPAPSGADGADLPTTAAAHSPAIMLPAGANARSGRQLTVDGEVAVSVHQSGPFRATLRTTRNVRSTKRGRDVVCTV